MEFLYEYGLFLTKAITIVVAIALIIGLVTGAAMKNKSERRGDLYVDNISDDLTETVNEVKKALLTKDEQKKFEKELKKSQKDTKKHESNLFVIQFNGSMHAEEVEGLREEISAIISVASENDKVLINLESPGGVVHGYGLAASQIKRLTDANIHVTVAVDKVAASGGYMMACVADKIISAPFAIIGSIGVIAQLPNINKLLKKNDIEIEQHTAGNFKRTLTVLGENTEEGREKFKQELADTHELFKQFVADNRPVVDIESVATGEHWYGLQALDLKLVDQIQTSDDFMLNAIKETNVYKVEYKIRKTVAEKLGFAASVTASTMLSKLQSWSFLQGK